MNNRCSSSLQMTSLVACEERHSSQSTTPLSTRQSHIVTKGSHEWLIEDFMKREEATGISLSTRFTTVCVDAQGVNYETVWRLKAYPKGCDNEHRDYLSIFINQVDTLWHGKIWGRVLHQLYRLPHTSQYLTFLLLMLIIGCWSCRLGKVYHFPSWMPSL